MLVPTRHTTATLPERAIRCDAIVDGMPTTTTTSTTTTTNNGVYLACTRHETRCECVSAEIEELFLPPRCDEIALWEERGRQ